MGVDHAADEIRLAVASARFERVDVGAVVIELKLNAKTVAEVETSCGLGHRAVSKLCRAAGCGRIKVRVEGQVPAALNTWI